MVAGPTVLARLRVAVQRQRAQRLQGYARARGREIEDDSTTAAQEAVSRIVELLNDRPRVLAKGAH
jgi:hypothetical protein